MFVWLALLGACTPTIPEGRFVCSDDDDCPMEMVCRTNVRRCFTTHADAGTRRDGAAAQNDAEP
jgi:hypothetical protein